MRSFMLDQSGDLVIEKNQIRIVFDKDLICQRIRSLLGANRGEWPFNLDYGINQRNILGKNPDYELIRSEIQQGLRQVDSSFFVEKFNADLQGRNLSVHFTARNSDGVVIKDVITWH